MFSGCWKYDQFKGPSVKVKDHLAGQQDNNGLKTFCLPIQVLAVWSTGFHFVEQPRHSLLLSPSLGCCVVKMISTEMKRRTMVIIMIVVMNMWHDIVIHHN